MLDSRATFGVLPMNSTTRRLARERKQRNVRIMWALQDAAALAALMITLGGLGLIAWGFM